jgi:hypothetical protein
LPGQQTVLLNLLNIWKPRSTVVDARGVGEQIAKYLAGRWAGVQVYTASDKTVSEDCYGLLALTNNDRVKVFAVDKTPEYAELRAQCRLVRSEIRAHEAMKLLKPQAGETRHIDMVKSMTYLPRALGTVTRLSVFF